MRKLSIAAFFFVALFFITASQAYAQLCPSGYSCITTSDEAACTNTNGSFSSCTSLQGGGGNCCDPWISCVSGWSCLNMSEAECQSGGGNYGGCYAGNETGSCCSRQQQCASPYKCTSLTRSTCEGSGGFYASCYTGTGAGNCCLAEQYCQFPQICRQLTTYECVDVWGGSVGPCSTPLVPNGNCCTYPLVPQKWSCAPGFGCQRAWIGHTSSNTCNLFCVGGNMPILCGGQSVDTAIGCIDTSGGMGFAREVTRIGLAIGGGVSFLLMVVAGFMIMSSGGDPKRLTAGKELLTAAIAGLLLIVLGTYLLRVIGVDILGIIPQ